MQEVIFPKSADINMCGAVYKLLGVMATFLQVADALDNLGLLLNTTTLS